MSEDLILLTQKGNRPGRSYSHFGYQLLRSSSRVLRYPGPKSLYIAKTFPMYLPKKEEENMQLVNAYIEQHYAELFHVKDLCRLVGYSKPKLYRIHKVRYNMTPMEYQIHLRMQHGAKFLQTDMSVKEVAIAVGYAGNKSKFGSLFKKHFGLTPMEYKKQFRINIDETAFHSR